MKVYGGPRQEPNDPSSLVLHRTLWAKPTGKYPGRFALCIVAPAKTLTKYWQTYWAWKSRNTTRSNGYQAPCWGLLTFEKFKTLPGEHSKFSFYSHVYPIERNLSVGFQPRQRRNTLSSWILFEFSGGRYFCDIKRFVVIIITTIIIINSVFKVNQLENHRRLN